MKDRCKGHRWSLTEHEEYDCWWIQCRDCEEFGERVDVNPVLDEFYAKNESDYEGPIAKTRGQELMGQRDDFAKEAARWHDRYIEAQAERDELTLELNAWKARRCETCRHLTWCDASETGCEIHQRGRDEFCCSEWEVKDA